MNCPSHSSLAIGPESPRPPPPPPALPILMEKGGGAWLALPTSGPFIGEPGGFGFLGISCSHRAHGPAGPPVEPGLSGNYPVPWSIKWLDAGSTPRGAVRT